MLLSYVHNVITDGNVNDMHCQWVVHCWKCAVKVLHVNSRKTLLQNLIMFLNSEWNNLYATSQCNEIILKAPKKDAEQWGGGEVKFQVSRPHYSGASI